MSQTAREEAEALLAEHAETMRRLPYAAWAAHVRDGRIEKDWHKGKHSGPYEIETRAEWVDEGSDVIRVVMTLENDGALPSVPRTITFTVSPETAAGNGAAPPSH